MNRKINVEFASIEKVRAQLKLLIMSETILPTKDGRKDIKYLQEKITRMKRATNIKYG